MTNQPAEFVRLTVDRSSVAMGDDTESHVQFWAMPAAATLDDLLVSLAESFLPPMGTWQVHLEPDDPTRRRTVGLVWPRPPDRGETYLCRTASWPDALGKFARSSELSVRAGYLTDGAAQPAPVRAVVARPSYTGARPTVLGTQARADALIDHRENAAIRARAQGVAGVRRAWIRDHLLSRPTPPAGAEAFVAQHFHVLGELLCNASMAIAGELLGLEGEIDGAAAVRRTGRPAIATLAMVIAAFEWGLDRDGHWPSSDRAHLSAYLDFLQACGYRLSEVEQLIADRARSPEQLTAEQARVRELRNAEYNLTRNHTFGLMDHQVYTQLLAPVVDELTRLGERPEPRTCEPDCALGRR